LWLATKPLQSYFSDTTDGSGSSAAYGVRGQAKAFAGKSEQAQTKILIKRKISA